jgi:hypothetical protein
MVEALPSLLRVVINVSLGGYLLHVFSKVLVWLDYG